MGSPLATEMVKVEIPPLPRVRRKIFESEPKTCVIGDDGNNKRLSDADDISCEITLKELRGRSKKKKKLLEAVGIRMQNISEDFHFNISQEEPDVRIMKEESDIKIKEEEFDFEKPLCAFKKVPNNAKARGKKRKLVNSSLESGISVEKITKQICSGSENSIAQTSSNIDEMYTGGNIDITEEMRIGSQASGAKTSDIVDMHTSVAGGDIDITEEMCIGSQASGAKTSNIDEMHMSVTGGDIHITEEMCIGSQASGSKTSNFDEMHRNVTGGNIDITEEMCIGSQASGAKTSDIVDMHTSVAGGDIDVTEEMCIGSQASGAETSDIVEMHTSVTGGDTDITEEICIGSQPSGAKTSNIDKMHMSVTGGDLESISLAEGPSLSVVNEASFEYTKLSEPISPLGETVNFGEIANMGFSHAISDSLPSVFELTKEGDVDIKSVTNHKLEESFPVGWDLSSVVRKSCKEYSSPTQPSSQLDCDATVQSPDKAVYGSTESIELSGCTFDVKGKVFSDSDTPIHLKENIVGNFGNLDITYRDSFLPSKPHNDGDPGYHGSSIAEQHSVNRIEEPMSSPSAREGECLPMTSPSARNGFSSAEGFKRQHGVQAYFVTRRLLSARKERLCQAMEIDELYSSLGNTRSGLKGATVNICAGQVDMKSKNAHETSQPGPKSILKNSPGPVGTPPHDGNGISSISACTQKAVAFSQRQMQDIESLTMKLMKELKSMKEVVEENLYTREYSSPPKYTTDETRAAIHKAAEVEETTKRWLSMMAKDCNRFCKIMRTSGKTAASEKKKITFADEAGGMLCHVKIFEGDDTDSASAPETQSAQ